MKIDARFILEFQCGKLVLTSRAGSTETKPDELGDIDRRIDLASIHDALLELPSGSMI
jgi:hypothetical protein